MCPRWDPNDPPTVSCTALYQRTMEIGANDLDEPVDIDF